MLGGNEPLPIEPEVWTARLRSLEIATWLGPDPVEALAERFQEGQRGRSNPTTRVGLN